MRGGLRPYRSLAVLACTSVACGFVAVPITRTYNKQSASLQSRAARPALVMSTNNPFQAFTKGVSSMLFASVPAGFKATAPSWSELGEQLVRATMHAYSLYCKYIGRLSHLDIHASSMPHRRYD
jgi:acyl-CoA synthetase (AMP-forming)/AMP-acid ligase II